jgi:flagellar hook-associated protein 3 FlgL
MRISTQMLFRQGLAGILDQQSRIATTQEQLATGQRVNRPSDDPIDAARIQQLERSVAQQGTYVENAERARQRLSVEEDALASAGEIVRRVRELTVQAASDPVGSEGRGLIAIELRQRLDELVSIANLQDGDGEFVFAGTRSDTRPFVALSAGVQYAGDSQERNLLIGDGTTVADGHSGDEVFMRVRAGNGTIQVAQGAANTGTGVIRPEPSADATAYDGDTYTIRITAPDSYEVLDSASNVVASGSFASGQTISFAGVGVSISGAPSAGDEFTISPASNESIFETIGRLADALERNPADAAGEAVQRQAIDDALGQLDNAEQRLLSVRAEVGGRLSILDDMQNVQEDVKLGLQKLVSDLRDLDYAEAVSRFEQELTALQAAQQSFARIQGNSLFRYL